MSTSNKGEKLVIWKKQMVANDTHRYEINGYDASIANFYYRVISDQFLTLQPGDYTISDIGGTQYLVIQSEKVKAVATDFQVGYEFIKTSSGYTPIGQADPEVIAEKYNQLETDFTNMFEYLLKVVPRLDDAFQRLNFTKLEHNHTWVFDEVTNSLRSIKVVDLQADQDIIVGSIIAAGNEQLSKIETEGNIFLDQVTDFRRQNEIMHKMYSIINGAHRYLAGGILEDRYINVLDRTANGNVLEQRTNLILKREYNGGRLEDRNIDIDVTIDLGQF